MHETELEFASTFELLGRTNTAMKYRSKYKREASFPFTHTMNDRALSVLCLDGNLLMVIYSL
uniref:Uncharacterized protein n=1 Tax=Anguilla anguilla TaxID=7936 RepID=A0A0E9WLT0_ANGAN